MNARAKIGGAFALLALAGVGTFMVVLLLAKSTNIAPHPTEDASPIPIVTDPTPPAAPTASPSGVALPPLENPPPNPNFSVHVAPPSAPSPPPTPSASPQLGTVVYTNPLSREPGEEWSDNTISRTPIGKRPYLGGFTTEPLTLTLADLPDHKLLRLTFDLFLMNPWDGSSHIFNHNYWDLEVVHGQNLIHTTFSNNGFFSDNNEQAFPDTYPCGPYPSWTGSAEHQTLGTTWTWQPHRTFDCSSVYHMVLTFPHTDPKIILRFKGVSGDEKPWGICHVTLEAIPQLTPLTETQLTALWNALGSSDPMVAFKAKWDLTAAGDVATNFIARHLADPVPEMSANVGPAITDLHSGDADKVNQAIETLRAAGIAAAPAVETALDDPDLPSVIKRQLRAIDRSIPHQLEESVTDLRLHRARHLLQVIHSEKAMALVEQIKTHPGDDGKYFTPLNKSLKPKG